MNPENRISRWRDELPGEESEDYIELLCDAEEELRRLRQENEMLKTFMEDLTRTGGHTIRKKISSFLLASIRTV